MINGKTVGLVMCGDPARAGLNYRILEAYRTYKWLDKSICLFTDNPAKSFNNGAKILDTDILICVAGDVYVGDRELESFVNEKGDVVFAWTYMDMQFKDYKGGAMSWWSRSESPPFVSGLFRCDRRLLVDRPLQEKPSFCEDILWQRELMGVVNFVAVNVPAIHIDRKSVILRVRDIRWAIIAPERFQHKTLPGRLIEILSWRLNVKWRRRESMMDRLERAREDYS